MRSGLLTVVVLGMLMMPALQVSAWEAEQGRMPQGGGGRIFGGELMSIPEREAFRQQLWNLSTAREKEIFRQRHREKMLERARDLGVPLADGAIPRLAEKSDEAWPEDGLRRLPNNNTGAGGLQRMPENPSSGLTRWGVQDDRPARAGVGMEEYQFPVPNRR